MVDRRLSIAVVDDEESVRVALRRLCHAYGMGASAFASVGQLFEALDGMHFDCLVLDAHMPGYGGVDAQAWLRECGISIIQGAPARALGKVPILSDLVAVRYAATARKPA